MSAKPKPYKIHAVGETAGSGSIRSLCAKGFITGPLGTFTWTTERDDVTCKPCLRRLGVQDLGATDRTKGGEAMTNARHTASA